MAKQTHCLSDIKVKALKEKGLHNDGGGLYLKVVEATAKGEATGTMTKSWIFRFKIGGRSRDMGLGKYPLIKLAAARELAANAYAKVRSGIDPIDERKQATAAPEPKSVVTFGEAAQRYIDAHEKSWKNEKHRYQWRATLKDYAGPIIGKKDVAAVELDDVLRILEPIWTEKAETATRLRGRIEAVLDWASVRGLQDGRKSRTLAWSSQASLARQKQATQRQASRGFALARCARIHGRVARQQQHFGAGTRIHDFDRLPDERSH